MRISFLVIGAASLLCACPQGSKDDESASAPTTEAVTETGAVTGTGSSTAEPTTMAMETGEQCMSFAMTSEGCQISGPSPGVCPAAPKGWSGAGAPGDACMTGTECAGIVCKCSDPVVEWYVGVCGCEVCADYAVACEQANVVDCKQIDPQA